MLVDYVAERSRLSDVKWHVTSRRRRWDFISFSVLLFSLPNDCGNAYGHRIDTNDTEIICVATNAKFHLRNWCAVVERCRINWVSEWFWKGIVRISEIAVASNVYDDDFVWRENFILTSWRLHFTWKTLLCAQTTKHIQHILHENVSTRRFFSLGIMTVMYFILECAHNNYRWWHPSFFFLFIFSRRRSSVFRETTLTWAKS